MTTSNLKAKLAKAAAVATVLAVGAGALLGTSGPAGADPKAANALIGVGSDTTQDIMNAYAGENFGFNYTPVQSSAATGKRQIVSWDSTNPDPTGDRCITTKVKSATIYRPNGSGSGRNALSRSITGTGLWGTAAPECGGPKGISGFVDFARSSNLSSTAGTDLTYLPFGRDFVGYAYYFKPVGPGAPITGNVTFTTAELQQIHTTSTVSPAVPLTFDPDGPGTAFPAAVPVIPCGIQTGSGTGQFWQQAMTGSTGLDQTATSACRLLAGGTTGTANGGPGRLQESDGAALAAKGNQVPGTMVIIGYSVANFISSSNLVTKTTLVPGVELGNMSSIVPNTDPNRLPIVGSGSNLTPNTAYYANTTFGRDVYNVFDSSLFDPAFPSSNADIKTIFGVGGSICNVGTGTFAAPQTGTPQATRALFGFGPSVNTCGGTSQTTALGGGTV